MKLPTLAGIENAGERLKDVIIRTPLQEDEFLSDEFQAQIYLKREDLQNVRSYKIRGAYNFISRIPRNQRKKPVVCASAGNHAQGVALSCRKLKIKGQVFMPETSPKQKVRQVQIIGKEFIEVILTGDTYDDAKNEALKYSEKNDLIFVPPFNDPLIIEGQGTVGQEILQQAKRKKIDYLFVPLGGGGLIAGLLLYFRKYSPGTRIIGAEPLGAPAMYRSLEHNEIIELDEIDNFVDGAAVKKVGDITFNICRDHLRDLVLVPEGRICTRILELYNRSAIIAEPAGALSVAALDQFREEIKGKNVVCVLSGGNNDIERMPDIKERSLIYEGLKHYFIIKFPQRSGALKEFVNKVLGPDDDITLFEYTKKNAKETGPALVGIELRRKDDYRPFLERMKKYKVNYTELKESPMIFNYLI